MHWTANVLIWNVKDAIPYSEGFLSADSSFMPSIQEPATSIDVGHVKLYYFIFPYHSSHLNGMISFTSWFCVIQPAQQTLNGNGIKCSLSVSCTHTYRIDFLLNFLYSQFRLHLYVIMPCEMRSRGLIRCLHQQTPEMHFIPINGCWLL